MGAAHLPPRRILAAVDFDETADAALMHAAQWAAHFGATLTLLHVPARGPDAGPEARDTPAELRALAARSSTGPAPELLVRAGPPAEAIAGTADEIDADLIVTGSHGRGAIGRLVLGSVAAGVLHATTRPVLLVRTPGPFLAGGAIVAAVDLGETAASVARASGRLAARAGAALHLLHVLPIGDHASPGHVAMKRNALAALERLREEMVPPDVDARLHVEMHMGEPARLAVAYADREAARLIVVGAHGRARLSNALLGDITQHLVHDTPRPVLVVRPGEET